MRDPCPAPSAPPGDLVGRALAPPGRQRPGGPHRLPRPARRRDDALAERDRAARGSAWRHAFAARRGPDRRATPEAAAEAVAAAREALDKCPPSADTALTLAYLAHVEVTADHFDAAMLLAVDASLLTEGPAAGEPSRALHQAHRWLSLTLSGLDLEELAVAHAGRGARASPRACPTSPTSGRLLQLSRPAARRAGPDAAPPRRRRARRASWPPSPSRCATEARELDLGARPGRRRPARRRPGVGA